MSEQAEANKRDGRLAGLVIALTTVLWLGLQWVGKQTGLDPRYAVLGDLAALAAYIFALAQVWRIWRRGSGTRGN